MKKVIVMMSAYNGEKYIAKQIDSILNQYGVEIKLFVRDDGSSDNTLDILNKYKRQGKLDWYSGDNLGSAQSFMDLIHKVSIDYDYYALSDQDDIWKPQKLISAVNHLSEFEFDKPALYYGNYTMADEKMNILDKQGSPVILKTMKQTVITNQALGCTMVFNKRLLSYLKLYSTEPNIMHDNLIFKVCMSLDGNIFYDDVPYIFYRQHSNNVIGGRNTLLSRLKRYKNMLLHNRCYRSKAIKDIYECYEKYMSAANRECCKLTADYKKSFNRFKIILDKDYRTGNRRIDFCFLIIAFLGVF